MINKAYIKIFDKNNRSIVNEALNNAFNENSIQWVDDIAYFVCEDVDSFNLQIEKYVGTELLEMGIKYEILIVPFFDDLFLKYLNTNYLGTYTAFNIFIKNINNVQTIKDCKRILSYFKKEEIDTIKALIKCNGNSFKAANELYLHRNSFNYRINKLQSRLNLSLRDLNTLIFLNLVFALF